MWASNPNASRRRQSPRFTPNCLGQAIKGDRADLQVMNSLKNSALPGNLPPHGSRAMRRAIDLASYAAIVATLFFWQIRVSRHISWTALASFMVFVLICLAYGRCFSAATAKLVKNRAGLSFQFLSGFFVANTLLFVASVLSPFGMATNLSMLALGALGLAIFGAQPESDPDDGNASLPSLLCILISGLAATLWSTDTQMQPVMHGQTLVYQAWQDFFFHVREISAFANAEGTSTLHHFRMSDAPAQLYHFASYLSASAISFVTNTPAVQIYSSFLLPLGIFLTGIAAFSLTASVWGGWPALAATAAVILLPDAYQQGFANKYLSYTFISQVSPGALYGIACAAIAWTFMLEGSRRGKITTIFVGYLFLLMCLFYKAHIFVANSFLVLIYPCLFFPGVRHRWRLAIGLALTGIFVGAIAYSQTLDRVPTLRLDGSGIGSYVLQQLGNFDEGHLKAYFTQVFKLERHSKPIDALNAVALLSVSTFGLWIPAALLALATARKKMDAAILAFPLLIAANYLVMSVGLAMDTRGIGTPDELLNRPLVWAYFAVAAWTGGAIYYLAIGNRPPKGIPAQTGLFALLCLAMTSPFVFSKGLQTFPAWKDKVRYDQFNSVPLCLAKAALFIKDNSAPFDIIQDSENDARFMVTALTERQVFAGESIYAKPERKLQERLDRLTDFRNMQEVDDVQRYAKAHHIDWYLLSPGTQVRWPSAFLETASFNCDGYRVFRFAN